MQENKTLIDFNDIFSYEPHTGVLRWKISRGTAKVNSIAGSVNCRGYLQVGYNGAVYLVHRVIWQMMTGCCCDQVDHKDLDKKNNKFSNLRSSNRSQNMTNKGLISTNKSGYKLIHWKETKKLWVVKFSLKGKKGVSKLFKDIEKAVQYRDNHAPEFYGEFYRKEVEMQTITGANVNEVYPIGLMQLRHGAVKQESQHGTTLEMPQPVSVLYLNPRERVLFDPVRDSNPFLNLFEALWILAGREDVKFLADLVPNMAKYSDDGETYFGAYGARLRGTSGYLDTMLEDSGNMGTFDQIAIAIDALRENPDNRQVVLTIRQPSDIAIITKDQPCNLMIALKIRGGKLNVHVFNRSNDFVWGMTGTNVVQFSMLQEYIAGKIGVEMGVYHQTTDSMHVYVNDQWDHIEKNTPTTPRYDYYSQQVAEPYHMFAGVADLEDWDKDLLDFFKQYDENSGLGISRLKYRTGYFADLIFPAWYAFQAYKNYRETKREASLEEAKRLALEIPADWGIAIREWLGRRGQK